MAGDYYEMHQHGAGSVQHVGDDNTSAVQQIQLVAVENAVDVVRRYLSDYPESQREELQEYLAAIDDEQLGEARPSRLKTFFKGLLSVVRDVGDAVSPVVKATVSGAVEGARSSFTG